LALADAGQLRLHLRPTDMAQVLRFTVENLAPAAEIQEVTLTVQHPGDLPLAQADPDRLAQVLRNLLINALRHTPPGGSVTVRAALADGGSPATVAGGRACCQAVEIAVVDTGEGIAPEDLPHVFERFWRADRARSRPAPPAHTSGTGLGLAVAQSLVEAQGGRLGVDSAPGQGSTFWFTLPLAADGA